MTNIRAVHRFFPVGQGLFATGSVECWPPARRPRRIINTGGPPRPAPVGPYRWVYDCGSSSGKRLVTNAIDDLKRDCQGEKIDLLTLSHVHNDHIGGVVELLNEIGAKTVMLPWAPACRSTARFLDVRTDPSGSAVRVFISNSSGALTWMC